MTEVRPRLVARPLVAAALAAFALFAAPAAQAEAFYVLRISDDARIIIDPAAVHQLPGSAVRTAATVTVQRSIVAGSPPQPGYVRSSNEYDCAAQAMRWKSFQAFSRSGAQLASRRNPSSEWKPVTPETLVEWRAVCGLSAGDSVVAADSVAKLVVALMAAFDSAAPPATPRAAKAARKS